MTTLKHHSIADCFSAKTRKALLKKGIAVIGLTTIPGIDPFTGKASFLYNTQTGYCLNDNDTHRVMTFRQVLALAEVN